MNSLNYYWYYHYSKTYYYSGDTYEDAVSVGEYGTFSKRKNFNWIRNDSMAVDIAARKVIRRRVDRHYKDYTFRGRGGEWAC